MLDIRRIRHDPDSIRAAIARRGETAELDALLQVDAERRKALAEVEELKHRRNVVSEEIAKTKKAGGDASDRMAAMREVSDRIKALDDLVKETGEKLEKLLLAIPNLPLPEAPDGRDEHDNVVIRTVGEPRELPFPALPHWELGARHGIIQFDWGVKVAGSRFYVLQGAGARLQHALIQWMLNLHVQQHGLLEIYPPFMVKEECFWATGDLPKFADNIYRDAEDDLCMVTTAEVPLTNIWRGEIIPPETLPLRYVAYTACFRREKMSAGRDVRGIKRGHQFDKVEMYTYCEPDRSMEEFEGMVARAEAVCKGLDLPYRIVSLCTGDLGFKAAITYDLEMWAPGVGEWLEVSSVSNVLDFQARRANIRFRREAGSKPELPHMLNGSGLALPRTMIAVIENYQQPDGSIVIPEVLRPYMGGMERIGP
jgi:seryl-tRNA synthetase